MPSSIPTNNYSAFASPPAQHAAPENNQVCRHPLPPKPAVIATSCFSSSPAYCSPPRVKRALADGATTHSLAGTSNSPTPSTRLLAGLQQAQEQYDQLTEGQPSFFAFTRDWLARRLQRDFSISTQDIYIDRYADIDGQRRLVSSRSLLTVFREAIAGSSLPPFDKGAVEISTRPRAGADPSPVPTLRSQPALDKLEKALREGAKDFPDVFRREEANYWSSPQTRGVTKSRKQRLAAEMANTMRTEAELRHRDGTLDDTSYRMVVAFADRSTGSARENSDTDAPPYVYSPYFTYADAAPSTRQANIPGALVLTQRSMAIRKTSNGAQLDAGKMVLLVPGQGIKTFDDELSLDQTLRKPLASGASQTAVTNYVLRSGDAIAWRAQDLLNATDEQWRQAFYGARGTPPTNGGTTSFGQELDRAVSMAPSVDTQGAIRERNAALIKQAAPDWLRNANPEQKKAWADANRIYLEALKHTPPLDARSLGSAELVRKYARYRLSETLKWEHGITLDPDKIKITHTWLESKIGSDPDQITYERESETQTLTDLSLTNTSWFDQFSLPGNRYEVSDERDWPIFGLDFKKIRHIVQSADVGGSYDEALKRLVTGKSRGDYAEVLHAAMRVQLLESQMQNLVIDDGVALVNTALDQPDAALRTKLKGQSVTVSQLLVGGATVNGVKLFETNPLDHGPLVLYTPEAPDGKYFREYEDRASMWSDLKSSLQMRQYLAKKVGLNDAGNVARVLDGKDGASVQASLITGNFLKQSYDADVALSRANADAQTTSNREMLLRDIKDGILLTYDVASTFLPVQITLPLALGRAVHSAWNAGQALRQGNGGEALAYAAEALMTLAFDALGEGSTYGSARHAPSAVLSKGPDGIVTLRMDTATPTQSLPDPALRAFEQRHITSATLRGGANGVYVQSGKPEEYVQIGGKWYASAEDGGRRFVYMPGEDGPSATWPIRRVSGQWQFTPLDEFPGRPITANARIPERYRVTPPADLSHPDSHGIFRSQGQEYIKIDDRFYRSAQGSHGRYIYDGNPSHRIAVRRGNHHWEITPPSLGRGGQRSGPIKTIQDIYHMNEVEARSFLDQYRFPANGPYTEHNFVLAIAYTDQIPGWAGQFKKIELTPNNAAVAGPGGSQTGHPALTPHSDQLSDGLPDFARIDDGNSPARSAGRTGASGMRNERDYATDPRELAGKLDRLPNAQAARRIVSGDEPDYFSISTEYGNPASRSIFVGDYEPGVWSLHNLERHPGLPVHASDIIREQYRKVSTYQNFFGRLPSKLKFTNVQNEQAVGLINRHIGNHAGPGTYEARAVMHEFMQTPLGKVAPRLADDFDLAPYDMKIIVTDSQKVIAELSVKPRFPED